MPANKTLFEEDGIIIAVVVFEKLLETAVELVINGIASA